MEVLDSVRQAPVLVRFCSVTCTFSTPHRATTIAALRRMRGARDVPALVHAASPSPPSRCAVLAGVRYRALKTGAAAELMARLLRPLHRNRACPISASLVGRSRRTPTSAGEPEEGGSRLLSACGFPLPHPPPQAGEGTTPRACGSFGRTKPIGRAWLLAKNQPRKPNNYQGMDGALEPPILYRLCLLAT